MSTTVWIHEPGRKSGKEKPKDGRVWREIRVAGPRGREGGGSEEATLGYLERDLPSGGPDAYLAARKEGARTFLLWADVYRQHLLAGDDFALTALADWWDPRVTAALAALVKSYDGWLGTPWDEGK
ncbi:hypothetical protein [Streptomyces lydicus]|uniref:hypothetical protein n=1 Tax=Streptomyces lydicus TaxID=47763 RepID=UPI00378A0FCD